LKIIVRNEDDAKMKAEKDKMLNGEPYTAADPDLVKIAIMLEK
jgi:hypothetical protein